MKSLLLAILIACFILVITAEGNLAFKTCSTYGNCLPGNYNKHKLPLRPIIIDTKIKIKQLTEILDKQGTVELLAVFDMTWNDNQIVIEPGLSDPEWHYEEWHEKIWQPDLYFYGMKDIDVHGFQHLKYMSELFNFFFFHFLEMKMSFCFLQCLGFTIAQAPRLVSISMKKSR